MMYTPTPSARRPRPPSRNRPASTSTTAGGFPEKAPSTSTRSNLNPNPNPTLSSNLTASRSSSSVSSQSPRDHSRRRREQARSGLHRIRASPSDVDDISSSPNGTQRRRPLGLGLSSSLTSHLGSSTSTSTMDPHDAEPSPPPPYGTSMPDATSVGNNDGIAPTPLRQDSGTYSHSSGLSSCASSVDSFKVEERRRARRATDAARAMGLEVDFASGSETREWSTQSEEEMSQATMRARMLEMKRQLKRRDNELLLAAEVANRALRTHEDLLAYLPSTVKARLPEFVHLFPPTSHGARQPSRTDSEASSSASGHHRLARSRDQSSNSTATLSAGPMTTGSTAHSSQLPDQSHPITDDEYEDASDSNDDFATADDEPSGSRLHTIRPATSRHYLVQPHPRSVRRHPAQAPAHPRYAASPRHDEIEAVRQAELDDRILALEQALNDAREGEENQRKLAARLRKEVDKLHRDFERAEDDREQAERPQPVGTPGFRGNLAKAMFKPRSVLLEQSGSRQNRPVETPRKDGMGWGSTSFPHFPAGPAPEIPKHLQHEDDEEWPDLGEYTDRLRRMTGSGQRIVPSPPVSRTASQLAARSDRSTPAGSTIRTRQVPSHDSTLTRSRRSTEKLTLPSDGRKIRKKISQNSFLDPRQAASMPSQRAPSPSPSRPRVTVEAPESASSLSASSRASSQARGSISGSRTIRRSPWPSPHGSAISADPSPSRSLIDYDGRQGSLSPGYASLSSRMESMRQFVVSALEASPSRPGLARTLGSELGSEFGDRADSSLRYVEEALMLGRPSPSRTHLSVDEDARSAVSEGLYQSDAPLPARVSAALSSLALALAPYTSPGPSKTIPGLPGASYAERSDSDNVFDEAFAMRKIRWADSTKSSMDSTGTEDFTTASVFALPARTTVNSSVSSQGTAAVRSGSTLKQRFVSPRPRPRPSSFRNSSDGSISLAHRRRLSQQMTAKSTPSPTRRGEEDDDMWEAIADDEDASDVTPSNEPQTIPGRLVHDLICLMAVLVDFVECAVVVVYRVVLDVRYGQRESLLGASRRAKMRRYYL